MIQLTILERKLFMNWLKQEATTDKALIEQMGIMPGCFEGMDKKMKRDLAAKLIVAEMLESIEEYTIEPPAKENR